MNLGEVAARASADPVRADALLREVKTTTQAAIADVRRLARTLRPPAIDDLGLVPALREHAVRVATGRELVVAVNADDLGELPAAVEVAVLRVAQEAMGLAAEHPDARRCTVRLARGRGLELEVTGDGPRTATSEAEQAVLARIRGWVDELGGSVRVETAFHGGSRLRVRFPLPGAGAA